MTNDPVLSSQASLGHGASATKEAISRQYRPVKPLPFELREHCTVYLQEQLYSQALLLLQSLLTAGSGNTSKGVTLPAPLPSSQVLALASTLIVYPSLTTALPAHEKIEAANQALTYLNHVNKIVGPVNAGFHDSFRFLGTDLSRSRRRDRASKLADEDEDESDDRIKTKAANENSVFNRASDFWSVVGWAFNCSVKHPPRWERWRLWLELMLDILNDDLLQRLAEQKTTRSQTNGDSEDTSMDHALLSQYLSSGTEGRGEKRRIMRAILADGSKKSMSEFPCIWKNETKPPKAEDAVLVREKKKLDFELDEYADYMDLDDDEEGEETPTSNLRTSTRTSARRKRPSDSSPSTNETNDDDPTTSDETSLGNLSSLLLRQRILALLATYAQLHPAGFVDTEDLFDLYTEFLRPLPLAIFGNFILPSTPYLPADTSASLLQMLLKPLISSDAPAHHTDRLTQDVLERNFLPFAANNSSAVDNAKVGLLVEGLMRLLWRWRGLETRAGLTEAVARGVSGRLKRVAGDGRRKTERGRREEEEAKACLKGSAERMMALLAVVEGVAGGGTG